MKKLLIFIASLAILAGCSCGTKHEVPAGVTDSTAVETTDSGIVTVAVDTTVTTVVDTVVVVG